MTPKQGAALVTGDKLCLAEVVDLYTNEPRRLEVGTSVTFLYHLGSGNLFVGGLRSGAKIFLLYSSVERAPEVTDKIRQLLDKWGDAAVSLCVAIHPLNEAGQSSEVLITIAKALKSAYEDGLAAGKRDARQ
jgi:hypothetical protein